MLSWLLLLLSLFCASPAAAQTKAVMEGVAASRWTVKVDTANGRVEIATTSYGRGGNAIPNVGLFTTSNVVVGAGNAVVLYATGALVTPTLIVGGGAISPPSTGYAFLAATQTFTGWNTFTSSMTLSSSRMIGGGLWRQYVSSSTSARWTLTSNVPYDNTPPQISEMGQVLLLLITPTSAHSKILIRATVNLDEISNSCNYGALCLFRDAGPSPIACVPFNTAGSPMYASVQLSYVEPAASVTIRDYGVYAGCDAANVVAVNSMGGAATYGGALTSILEAIEIEGR